MRRLPTLVFWTSMASAAWTLVGYALALALLRPRPWQADSSYEPSVTIVVPGYRERDTLPGKLAALDELDYPADRLEVLVPIDGDRTLAELARAAAPRATVLFEAERKGKSAGLSRALDRASGDVVIMTDANNILERGSLRAAVRHFADPEIWAVAGRRGEVGSAYDRYEDWLRLLESRSGSVAAMSGEFMAVRRERAPHIPGDVVNDDFWLLCRIVADGGRVVYEPAAGSVEPPPSIRGEVARRTRMGAGRVMAVGVLRSLPPTFAWRVASHKVGRLALPFAMAGALVSSLTLARRPSYRMVAAAQLGCYGLGAVGASGRAPRGPLGWLCRALGQFVLGNLSVGLGVVRALRGRQTTIWEPVD